MYYDELLETAVNTDVTPVDKSNHKQPVVEKPRNSDKNYERYNVPFNKTWKDGRFYDRISIENFGSGQIGTRIRNAVTGQKYPYFVGSKDEDLLFKVTDASGRNARKYSLTLYYDTPEQYENHHFITVNKYIKERWYEKNLEARR